MVHFNIPFTLSPRFSESHLAHVTACVWAGSLAAHSGACLNRNRCENDNPDQVFTQNRIGYFHAVFTQKQCSLPRPGARPHRRGRFNGPGSWCETFSLHGLWIGWVLLVAMATTGNSEAGVSAQTPNNAANSNLLILCQEDDREWKAWKNSHLLPTLSPAHRRNATKSV